VPGALRQLEQAEQAFRAVEMKVHAAVCALQHATLRGATNEDAEGTLRREGIKDPPRFANALAPVRALEPSPERAATVHYSGGPQ